MGHRDFCLIEIFVAAVGILVSLTQHTLLYEQLFDSDFYTITNFFFH